MCVCVCVLYYKFILYITKGAPNKAVKKKKKNNNNNTGCKKYSSKNSISNADQIRRLTSNRNIHFRCFNDYIFAKINKEM